MTEAFGIGCPLPKKGCSYDTTAIKSTNRDLGNPEMIRGRPADIAKLRRELDPYTRRHDSEWTHSTSGCISPVEFRRAGLREKPHVLATSNGNAARPGAWEATPTHPSA